MLLLIFTQSSDVERLGYCKQTNKQTNYVMSRTVLHVRSLAYDAMPLDM